VNSTVGFRVAEVFEDCNGNGVPDECDLGCGSTGGLCDVEGFRSSELRSLTPASFDLPERSVTVQAACSKRRRTDTLPIRKCTLPELQAFLSGRNPFRPVFTMPCQRNVVKMFRRDCVDAEIAADEIDFHCLRHTFITNLARGNVHPKTAQMLARHSSIELTMGYYTHMGREQLDAALDVLPDVDRTGGEMVGNG
jgi:integrase